MTVNFEFESYNENVLLKDVCNMLLLQIGEVINRLSDEFNEEYDGINWKGFVGMRNIQAHRYEHLIEDIFMKLITEDIPQLKSYLESIL